MKELMKLNIQMFSWKTNPYLTISESYVGSGSENYSKVNVKVTFSCSSTTFNQSAYAKLTINGSEQSPVYINVASGGGTYTADLGTFQFTHNEDGSLGNIPISVYVYVVSNTTATVTGTYFPTKISRYFSSTPKITLSNATETTMTYNWSTSEICKSISWNGGGTASFTGLGTKSGTINVTGLIANKSYSHYGIFTRNDSGLTSNSNTSINSTYNYPYCTSLPDFTIGNNVNLKFYNPLNRTIQIQMWSHKSGNFVSDLITISGTSYSGFSNVSDRLYGSIPNDTSSIYNIDVHYGSNKSVCTGGSYHINTNECTPVFNDFSYEDTSSINKITGDSSILVNGVSDCLFKISVSNRAIAKKHASIVKYTYVWGSVSNSSSYSSTSDVSSKICGGNGNNISVTAIDSRGLTTTVTKIIQNILYVNASINSIEAKRKDGVSSETYLTGKFTIWNGNWNSGKPNILTYVGYRVLINNVWTEYFDITTEVKNKMHSLNYNTVTTITLTDNDKIQIHSNGTDSGFEVGKNYTIQVLIKDGTSENVFTPSTYQATLQSTISDGKVGMSRYKDGNGDYHYGINGMPDSNHTLNIEGNLHLNKPGYDAVLVESDTANVASGITARRKDTNTGVALMVGSGGVNHGLWSHKLNKWLVHADGSKVYFDGIQNDLDTNNTTDTWVPVIANGKLQHRVINANINTNFNGYISDFNNATTNGWYRYYKETANRPAYGSGWGAVVVQNGDGWIFQTAYGTYTDHDTRIAHRGYINGSWTNWSYVADGGLMTSLYSNSNGTTGTVTLSSSSANFSYLEIFYMKKNNYTNAFTCHSVKVASPNGKKVALIWGAVETADTNQICVATKTISGSSIIHNYSGFINVSPGNVGMSNNSNEIYITLVIGYR